ncbi:MAG: mechanosensitive ion channel family protein [Candidatus Cardinium sp.]|uniref:mechanosensitive ion channel family protein n=1 Tax=Cardinium endosymbiont of Dermatophagoides farinae TaxID=2597823 RepID=UPI0016425ED4|nr:mechanosensitive ion channel domain-containing protein [Cardinium endosymbiont of Dermatophagoides farinae]UWW97351.1 MAG: mechanosensitive ion channel family protein [Candidatus Cardinium sp.]
MLAPIIAAAHNRRIDDLKINLSSPYDTVYTHFMLLNPGNKAAEHVGTVFLHGETFNKKSKEMAIKLKRLLTLKGINIETIPKDPNYMDPTINENRFILSKKLPKVYLIKEGEQWRYSKETLDFIREYEVSDRLHTLLYYFLPKTFCKKKILNLAIWQYIMLIGLAMIIWLTHKVMPYFLKLMVYKFIGSKKSFAMERLLMLVISMYFLKSGLTMFQSESLPSFINRVIEGAISFVWMCLAYECINLMQYKIKIAKKHHKFMIHILPLFSITAKIIVGIVGLVQTIDNLGFETGSLVQALSFSTLGIGLACQDTIKNLFGSLMITMDRPFSVEDEIVSGGIRGKVEEVGLRSTLLRTKEGSLVYIPNAKLADAYIDNFGKRTSRMVSLEVPLSYTTPLELLPRFIQGLREIAASQPLVEPERTKIYFDKMNENGFVVIFTFHLDTTESNIEYACKNRAIPLILKLAHQLNIRLGNVQYITHIEALHR